MMLFRDEETGMYIPLEVLAMKLAPLLTAQPPPEEVDLSEQVYGLTQRLAAVETERDELAETVARRERQNTTLARTIEGMADSRDRLAAELAQVRKDSDAKIEMLYAQLTAVTLRSLEAHRNVAAVTAERDGWRDTALRYEAERDEARRVATQRAERLEAIPWRAIDVALTVDGAPEWKVAVAWLNANRPTTEANS